MSNNRHGHYKDRTPSPTYNSWYGMKARCDNPNRPNYKDYGGLDIGYDPRWRFFENFLEDMGERPTGTTLDRINNNQHYTKDNCRWATPAQQTQNSASAIVTEEQVREIRALWNKGYLSQGKIGSMFGIKQQAVSAIVSGKRWKNVT